MVLPTLMTLPNEGEAFQKVREARHVETTSLVAALAEAVATDQHPVTLVLTAAAREAVVELDHLADPTFGRRMLQRTQWRKVVSGTRRDRSARVKIAGRGFVRDATTTVLLMTPATTGLTAPTLNTRISSLLQNIFTLSGRAAKLL